MIIAVDPGAVCGVFWTDGVAHGYLQRPAYQAILEVETRYLNDTWRSQDLAVVCERWDTTAAAGRFSRQHDALETIGALRYLCRKEGVEFVLQARADRLRVTPQMLEAIGWNVVGEHATQAARHALVQYVVRYSQRPIVARLVAMMNATNGENDGEASDRANRAAAPNT